MQRFDAPSLKDEDLEQILSFLRTGGVIGFPTDTAYGLGADPFNEAAVRRIYEIKRRPETKPILLLVNSVEMAAEVAHLSGLFFAIARRFWPGPLTIVLPALDKVSRLLTAGTGGIGVRWCRSPFVSRLLEAFGRPLTATSANLSGSPAPVTADEVAAQLGDRLEVLIDGGSLPVRGGSTVLDLTKDPPVLLREGPVTFAELNKAMEGHIH
jgi:L-threonylcarbamoyladenylate synthase